MISIRKNITIKIIFFVTFFIQHMAFAECVEGDCTSGIGKLTFNNGSYYIGGFEDSIMHGYGRYICPFCKYI